MLKSKKKGKGQSQTEVYDPEEPPMTRKLKKEYEQFLKLTEKDKEFKDLADADEKANAKEVGYFTQEEKSIVGKQAKSKVEDMV